MEETLVGFLLMGPLNLSILNKAFKDFRYLLNKGYPREKSLDLVGNRYNLNADYRHILRRAIYSVYDAKVRKNKLLSAKDIVNKTIGIDGYNVIITIETALKSEIIIQASDGLIRDIAGVSAKYRITSLTYEVINLITELFKKYSPLRADFYLDSPISKSGELSKIINDKLKKEHIRGKAEAVKVPEVYLANYKIISSSDSALIDKVPKVFDIAKFIITKNLKSPVIKSYSPNPNIIQM